MAAAPTVDFAARQSMRSILELPLVFLATVTNHKMNNENSRNTAILPFSSTEMIIKDLARYAVKGLAPDKLSKISLSPDDKTFPDDRRYALMKRKINHGGIGDDGDGNDEKSEMFDEMNPAWLHKENFLCAFTDPEFMAQFQTSYEIMKSNNGNDDASGDGIQRLLTVRRRSLSESSAATATGDEKKNVNVFDLNSFEGREKMAQYFMDQAPPSISTGDDSKGDSTSLVCVTQTHSPAHTHQFGNTSKGFKMNNGDSRTIHIVNEATVREFEDKINSSTGVEEEKVILNPMRFRPNIVVDGLQPWKEFDLVGKRLKVIRSSSDDNEDSTGSSANSAFFLKVLSKTVRCAGIGVDPSHPKSKKLDVPQLLAKYFPQHGPYLGIYAVIECQADQANDNDNHDFNISVGDRIQLVLDDQ